MPFINKPCDNCQRTDLEVYERYQVQSGDKLKFKVEQETGRLVPFDVTYWCSECSKNK